MQTIQHTDAFKKTDTIETVHGCVSAFEWLESEKVRIGKDPSRVVEIKPVEGGRRALFVNDVGIAEKGGYTKKRILKGSYAK